MKKNHLMLAMAAIALLSCTREKVDAPETITIRAYQEGATETRTTLIDGGTQVYWEPSDELKLFFRGSGSRFLSQNTEITDIAEFSGSLNVVVGVNEGASGSNTLWGLYPYRADATSDGESVTTTLPTEQTGRAGSFAKGTFITLAKSNSFDLAFYNVCGGIRFSLTQEGVKEVVFQGQNDESIAGKVKLSFVNGIPAVQEIIDGQKTITLTAPNGGTFETGQWYYIVALPGTLSNGFKMTFNTATQYATLKSSGSKTIKRGIFGSLADADEDLVYKDKGGDEPPVTGNIVFADLAAKYACVAKYDTDGDGEVSVEEAEAATSFDGLFTDWKGVTSFDEIRYFKNVHSLSGVFNGCNKLVSITVPENITNLGSYAFSDCTSLTSVVLSSGISSTGSYTFQNCSTLSSVVIPSNVTEVGKYAFSGCSSLTAVELPSGVTSISSYAFQNCASLVSIDIPSGVTFIADYTFQNCVSLASIDLPSGVSSIGQYAFCGCSSLGSIGLPPQLNSIGSYAFSECSYLTEVVIPEGVTSIPEYCFYNCRSLTSITFHDGISSIGRAAFSGVNMWKLELPSSITSLGDYCFYGIVCIILPPTIPVTIQPDTFNGVPAIFVPSNLIALYCAMTNWANYAPRLHSIDDYREKNEFTLATSGAVDMGTSVRWAACNLGATRPEESGYYYAWGETETKSRYSWSTYKWCMGSSETLTKYCNNSSYGYNGFTDDKTTLDLEDDAAHANLGGSWRMPTDEEWTELREGCAWEWINHEGKIGGKVFCFETGNSIFLPTAGYRVDNGLAYAGTSYYWSSSLDMASPYYYALCNIFGRGHTYRCYGLLVRPVCD